MILEEIRKNRNFIKASEAGSLLKLDEGNQSIINLEEENLDFILKLE